MRWKRCKRRGMSATRSLAMSWAALLPIGSGVSRAGYLFTRHDAEILTSESLDECYPSLTVGGVELLAGDIVESTDPTLFVECVDSDIYMRISEGEWRPIE